MPRLGACDWQTARADLECLEAAPDFQDAAAAYHARWLKHSPDYFIDRRRERARRAFDNGDGWACRLLSSVETVAHFTMHHRHLGLDISSSAPHLLFSRANVALWKAAILRWFKGPCRWCLELGEHGRIHAHILADLWDGPPGLDRTGRTVIPCEGYYETVVGYVLKPPLSYTADHLAIWIEAKSRGRLPTLAGSRGIPTRRTWDDPSRLRVYFALAPSITLEHTSAEPESGSLIESPDRSDIISTIPVDAALRLHPPSHSSRPHHLATTAPATNSGHHYRGSSETVRQQHPSATFRLRAPQPRVRGPPPPQPFDGPRPSDL